MPILALLLVLAAPDPSAAKQLAKDLFQKGTAAYALGDFAVALDDYTQAYAADPIPGFLFNIAQCHRALHDWELASDFYHRFIVAKPDAKNAEEVWRLIAEVD